MHKPTRAIQRIVKRNGTTAAYDPDRIVNAIHKATVSRGAPDRRLALAMARRVESALVSTYRGAAVPSVEDIQDIVERVLMEHGHAQLAKDYIIYRHQRALIRAGKAQSPDVSDNVPYRKIYEVLRWNLDHDCGTAEGLNRTVRGGVFPELVRACERRLDDEIRRTADRIADRLDTTRVVIIAGPSSSGKTTTAVKVGARLREHGVRLKTLNVDHYFFDLETHPRDEFGDYDYETPQALDMSLINRHLAALLDGERVRTPHYDFKTGNRTLDVHPVRLGRREVLLIDSLHGLHEAMTHTIPAEAKFKLYIEALGQFRGADGSFMRWADNRLLRRMNRDKDTRNLQPMETLTHWHYVRRSELRHIIPFIRQADDIVNTALPYELPVFRRRLFTLLGRARRLHADDPRRLDAHIRANRVYALLQPLAPVKDETCIPADSLFREFIGGSAFKLH
jgi:uridine kinase